MTGLQMQPQVNVGPGGQHRHQHATGLIDPAADMAAVAVRLHGRKSQIVQQLDLEDRPRILVGAQRIASMLLHQPLPDPLEARADLVRRHSGCCANSAVCAKTVPQNLIGWSFGTIGTIGTAPLIEMEERIAMALEGGVPALYAEAFARMQVSCPAGMSSARWQQAINDAGCFLDAHGAAAAALGWRADDLFSPTGLVWALAGNTVTCLSPSQAVLSDGRVVTKELRFIGRDVVS